MAKKELWYHVVGHYGGRKRYWWNRRRDNLIQDVLTPLAGHHVTLATRRGQKALFNFGAIDYAVILSTETRLSREESEAIPIEFDDVAFVNSHNITGDFLDEIVVDSAIVSSRSTIQRSLQIPKNQLFVIMKFGDKDLDSSYLGVVRPLFEEFGYSVLRVDQIEDSGNIGTQILSSIAESAIIYADLSGERPNCYFEAGYASALGKEIILTIRNEEQVHFDLAGNRFIRWDTEMDLRTKLRSRVESIRDRR